MCCCSDYRYINRIDTVNREKCFLYDDLDANRQCYYPTIESLCKCIFDFVINPDRTCSSETWRVNGTKWTLNPCSAKEHDVSLTGQLEGQQVRYEGLYNSRQWPGTNKLIPTSGYDSLYGLCDRYFPPALNSGPMSGPAVASTVLLVLAVLVLH